MGWNGGETWEPEEVGYRLSAGQVAALVLGYLEGPAGVWAGPAQLSPKSWSASCPGLILSILSSTRRLDANLISLVPERSFEGLSSLRHLWLDDNALTEIPVRALNNLPALQAMTLALNRISHIPDYAFQNLTSLVVL